jgi:hypothetical protein
MAPPAHVQRVRLGEFNYQNGIAALDVEMRPRPQRVDANGEQVAAERAEKIAWRSTRRRGPVPSEMIEAIVFSAFAGRLMAFPSKLDRKQPLRFLNSERPDRGQPLL